MFSLIDQAIAVEKPRLASLGMKRYARNQVVPRRPPRGERLNEGQGLGRVGYPGHESAYLSFRSAHADTRAAIHLRLWFRTETLAGKRSTVRGGSLRAAAAHVGADLRSHADSGWEVSRRIWAPPGVGSRGAADHVRP